MYCMYGMLKRSIRRGNDLPVDRAICRRMCTGRSARRPQGSTMRSITRIRLAASERISGRSCSACTSGARETNGNAPPGASARGPHRDAPSRTAAGRGSPSSIARARSTRGRVAQTADGRRRRGEGKENWGQTSNGVCPRFSSRHWGRRRCRAMRTTPSPAATPLLGEEGTLVN